jgi:hypothetical protein
MGVASQRATEAATLAAEQRLDPQTQSELASSLVAHAQVAEQALDEQATSAPQVSVQEAARFEARLSEYERVIASIAEDDADSVPTMAAAIRGERARVASVRARAEESVDDGSEAIHAIVRGRLSAAQRVAKDNHGAFSPETADAVAESIETASATLPDLDRATGASSTRADLMRSLEQTERLATFVETSAAIHQRIRNVSLRSIQRPKTSRCQGISSTSSAARRSSSSRPRSRSWRSKALATTFRMR